jgi:hypothetical protein
MPSSPPVTKALEDVTAEEGCHDTAQTSPVSAIVETAARAAKSQTLMVLSAELSQLINGDVDIVVDAHTQIEQVVRLGIYPSSGPMRNGQLERLPLRSLADRTMLCAHRTE